jgi:hypothetical protein
VVNQSKILDLKDCQIYIVWNCSADDLEPDLWSFELILDQEAVIQVTLCIFDPHVGHYTLSNVKC